MPFMPIPAIALLAGDPSAYPEGFTARCTGGRETVAMFPADPARPVILGDDASNASYTVTIQRLHGRFEVELDGRDYSVRQAESGRFRVHVLKAEAGDLVLSVETDSRGRSLTVYHLRYAGARGALTASSTSYRGHGSDDTSLMTMSCKIDSQPVP